MGISNGNKRLIDEYKDSDKLYIKLDNEPIFKEDEIKKGSEGVFGYFSELDELRRCGTAFACIGIESLSFGQDDRISPKSKLTGFPLEKEENRINGNYVFQRCHLIGYHLFAKKNDNDDKENANKKRIFAGTRFMNSGMLNCENMVVNYVKKTNNRVLYRVTPYFEGNNQLVYGVQIEVISINKNSSESLSFNIFVYNKQPDIVFDYKTGKISRKESMDLLEKRANSECSYVLNKKSKRFHTKHCPSVCNIVRKSEIVGKRDTLMKEYRPCSICDSGVRMKG